MKCAPKTHSGFTLIEVALAATILGVAFVGMVEALAIGSEMLDTARKQTIAAQIMQAEAEYLRMQSWTTVNSLASTSADYLSNYSEFASTSLATFAGTSFKFARTVNTNPHANLRWITMTV
ncbi:MAG: prepilin-type N-terminal cleavage/methylation domain-containing protein, partial [Opitutaceae bacterium]